jgi:hypothetical protein
MITSKLQYIQQNYALETGLPAPLCSPKFDHFAEDERRFRIDPPDAHTRTPRTETPPDKE